MSENRQDQSKHKKRIARLRKIIVSAVVLMCTVPMLLSVLALIRLQKMDERLDDMQKLLFELAAVETTTKQTQERSSVGPASAAGQTIQLPAVEMQSISGNEALEGKRRIYLSFDDGPSEYTDDILNILEDYDVKATFFVTAHEGYEEQYRRIVEEGHTLGMHSYSHDYKKIYSDLDGFAADLDQIRDFIKDVTGVESVFYRFPGGSSNDVHNMDMQICIDYLMDEDIVYFDWNVSAEDATGQVLSATDIVNNVIGQIERLDAEEYVVLMHDAPGKRSTVEALPIIIEKIQGMEDTLLLPITEDTKPVQHVLY